MVSLLLVGVGAILIWGVTGEASGIDIDAIGVILIVIGVLSFALTVFFWQSFWGPGYFRRRTYVDGDPYYDRRQWGPRRRATVVEEEDAPPPGPPGPPP